MKQLSQDRAALKEDWDRRNKQLKQWLDLQVCGPAVLPSSALYLSFSVARSAMYLHNVYVCINGLVICVH